MTTPLSEDQQKRLSELLRERVSVIADHDFRDRDPNAHLAKLKEVSENLSATHSELKAALPPRLNHFLTQSSYEKALLFLDEM